MATNYVNEGTVVTITAGAAYSSGDVVVVGETIGVALEDIASGATGAVQIEGVFTVPKVSAAVIAQGEEVIWDSSAGAFDDNALSPASGDISGCCIAMEAGAATTTTIDVKFLGGFCTLA